MVKGSDLWVLSAEVFAPNILEVNAPVKCIKSIQII